MYLIQFQQLQENISNSLKCFFPFLLQQNLKWNIAYRNKGLYYAFTCGWQFSYAETSRHTFWKVEKISTYGTKLKILNPQYSFFFHKMEVLLSFWKKRIYKQALLNKNSIGIVSRMKLPGRYCRIAQKIENHYRKKNWIFF